METTTVRLSDIPYLSTNVFGLREPDKLKCRILRYSAGHSTMSIHILDDNTQSLGQVLEFDTVLYFEGAMGWQGANFCTSTQDEHFDLIGNLRGEDITAFKEFNAFGRMLIVSTPRVNTKLIAHAATLVDYDDWYAHYRKKYG